MKHALEIERLISSYCPSLVMMLYINVGFVTIVLLFLYIPTVCCRMNEMTVVPGMNLDLSYRQPYLVILSL